MGFIKPEIIPLSLAYHNVSNADKVAVASTTALTNTTLEEDDDVVLSVDEHARLSDLMGTSGKCSDFHKRKLAQPACEQMIEE